MLPWVSTADAVSREAAWLNSDPGDGLPVLPALLGGPWDNVQAYYPRVPYQQQRSIYVLRRTINQDRWGGRRVTNQHPFRLILWWPLLDQDGSAEADQQAFDDAVDMLLQRITGPLGDKTHGGRFLSVAENPRRTDVDYSDPEHTLPTLGGVRAEVSYTAEDPEIDT